ncbi:MAG TPA: SURF1 family protein [Gemmatimonadales bacterium]|nr:SURF1 family protein [Gemmatimonadales bacterium]
MTPRRRATFVALLLAIALACALLGRWQLRRLHERRAANAAALAARSAPPVVLAPNAPRPAALEERRVVARGTYDPAHAFVIRGRVFEGNPGVYVVTPLRLAGSDTAVLVRRGFVPAADAVSARADTFPEPGSVTVTGLAAALRAAGGGEPLTRPAGTTWRYLDLGATRLALPYPLLPVVVQQLPDPALPRYPRRLPAPALDDGPHLSYAIQWFAFMTIALVGAGIFWKRF